MADLDSVLACLDLNLDRSVERLQDLLRIPSHLDRSGLCGGLPPRAPCALTGDLEAIGFTARVAE